MSLWPWKSLNLFQPWRDTIRIGQNLEHLAESMVLNSNYSERAAGLERPEGKKISNPGEIRTQKIGEAGTCREEDQTHLVINFIYLLLFSRPVLNETWVPGVSLQDLVSPALFSSHFQVHDNNLHFNFLLVANIWDILWWTLPDIVNKKCHLATVTGPWVSIAKAETSIRINFA